MLCRDWGIEDLARSIRANGIIQPIIVRREGLGYQIIAGERRWRAAQRAAAGRAAFVEGDFDKFDAVFSQFEHVTKGREAITALEQDGVQTYIRGTISAVINDDFRAVDGPVVRFSGGGYTWRIDGAKYAFLLPKGLKACRHAVDTVLAGAV